MSHEILTQCCFMRQITDFVGKGRALRELRWQNWTRINFPERYATDCPIWACRMSHLRWDKAEMCLKFKYKKCRLFTGWLAKNIEEVSSPIGLRLHVSRQDRLNPSSRSSQWWASGVSSPLYRACLRFPQPAVKTALGMTRKLAKCSQHPKTQHLSPCW